MTPLQLALITVGLLFFTNFVGFVYSYIVLYKKFFLGIRIQDKSYKPDVLWARLPLVLMNVAILMFMAFFGIYFLSFVFDTIFPSVWVLVAQVLFMFIVDDLCFYILHRYLHTKYMMQHIHRIHHSATTPFPLEYIYAHPIEWIINLSGPVLAVVLMMGVNIYSLWLYLLLRNFHELDIHSGLKSKILKYIPFYGTVEHHDKHHEKLNGNYASTFTLWDKIFKTEIKEVEKEKQKA